MIEKTQKIKTRIKDSIAITKGYHKIHGNLMIWRRNIYLILLFEVFLELIYAAFQIYFMINRLEIIFLCWILIFLVKINVFFYILILGVFLYSSYDFGVMFPLLY